MKTLNKIEDFFGGKMRINQRSAFARDGSLGMLVMILAASGLRDEFTVDDIREKIGGRFEGVLNSMKLSHLLHLLTRGGSKVVIRVGGGGLGSGGKQGGVRVLYRVVDVDRLKQMARVIARDGGVA